MVEKKKKSSTPRKNKKKVVEGGEGEKKINAAIDSIQTRFGEDAIMMLGEHRRVEIDSISTGSLGLDKALGVGGLPRGRVIEIFGPESSGKTTLALHAVAEAQKKNGVCAFIDAEHALDPEYAKKIGVQTKKLLVSQPNNGEQALEIVDSLIRSGTVDVIVVDSVAALTPKREIEGDIDPQKYVGTQARLMSMALRRMTGAISKSKTIVIFINQIRMQVGVFFGNPETTPGGKALKFYSSVRIDIRRIQQIKKGDEVVGGRIRVKIVKNKVAPPFRSTEFDLLYNEGISPEGELLALGEKYGFILKSGASYSYGDTKLGRGYNAACTFLKENTALTKTLKKQVLAEE